MVRDTRAEADEPDLESVLDALSDPDCRTLIRAIDDPMTANELSEATEIPQSTAYRKLDLLSEASLLDELTEIRSDGRHTTRYAVDFEDVRVALTEDRRLEVEVSRPPTSPDERLADMWSEVQQET